MEREHKLLPLSISLLSGLAVSVMMIVRRNFSLTSVVIVLAVMLGFYIVGLIFRAILIAFKTKEEPQQTENADGENETVEVTSESDSVQEEQQDEEG
ncbi:MAG: hypothetical protein HDT13_06385 [Butyrivibrio sp.]|nr:hypothetical protein [Butyrivibrio sp.]